VTCQTFINRQKIGAPANILVNNHGRRNGGACPHWILKISAKKGCFLSFEGEIPNFTTFGPRLEKSPGGSPLEKILPTTMPTTTKKVVSVGH